MSCEYPQTKSQPHFFLIFNFQLIKMFSDELEKISWEETTKAIYSKTDADVRYQAQAGSEFGGWIFTDEIIVK